jgi:hypothetical protein
MSNQTTRFIDGSNPNDFGTRKRFRRFFLLQKRFIAKHKTVLREYQDPVMMRFPLPLGRA